VRGALGFSSGKQGALPRSRTACRRWRNWPSLPGFAIVFEWISRERQWINERHLELCRIPAPTFLEQKRAEWMAGQFRQSGYDVHIDRAGNVVALQPAEGTDRLSR